MDKEDGVLVPFSYFYDPLHKFIDHQHSQVISDAENNSKYLSKKIELIWYEWIAVCEIRLICIQLLVRCIRCKCNKIFDN